MSQSLLGDLMGLDRGVPQQGLLQCSPAVEVGGRDALGDPAVEAFHHAVERGPFGRDEAVFDAMALTDTVEEVTAGGCALAGGADPIGERPGGVGEDFGDLKGCLLDQAVEESSSDVGLLGGRDFQVDPTGGPVDGVDVDETFLVVLEARLGLGLGGLSFLGGNQGREIRTPVAPNGAYSRRLSDAYVNKPTYSRSGFRHGSTGN